MTIRTFLISFREQVTAASEPRASCRMCRLFAPPAVRLQFARSNATPSEGLRECVSECVLGRGFMFEGMRYCLSFMQMKADDRKNKYILH